MIKPIIIATRKSELALWQARKVAKNLTTKNLDSELLPLSTQGDRNLDQNLADLGGKGVFIKELEVALLEKKANIAVHSMKDVPVKLLDDFIFPLYLKRDNPSDCLVVSKKNIIKKYPGLVDFFYQQKKINQACLNEFDNDFVFATSSLRRSSQLIFASKKISKQSIVPIRGNLNTRLRKLSSGIADGLVLARAGIDRLCLGDLISNNQFIREFKADFLMLDFDQQLMLPAIAQGVIGVECLNEEKNLIKTLQSIDDKKSRITVGIERKINALLGGSCSSTLCAHAKVKKNKIKVLARVLSIDGSVCIEVATKGKKAKAITMAKEISNQLIQRGAMKYLQSPLN